MNVLLPVEMMMRELDFRLVLAVKYASKRHRIFLGQTFNEFRLMQQMDGGLLVSKAISQPWPQSLGKFPGRKYAYDVAKDCGFSVVHLAEEGAVFMGREDAWAADLDLQLDPTIFREDDAILTWGDWQRDYYKSKHPANEDRILTTGHPRFDLYQPRYHDLFRPEADALKAKYGNFVLINTNFGLALHPQGQDFVFSQWEGWNPTDDATRTRFIGQWSRTFRSMAAFVELVHLLSIARKDVNFVVRPHPGDDDFIFRSSFKDVPNIHVVREGTVVPWLLASRLVVHDGCTTGLEAYLLDKPVLNYRPIADEATDLYLPNVFGVQAVSKEEALEGILGHLERPEHYRATPPREEIPERAHSLFANFRREAFPLVIEQMLEAEGRAKGHGKGPDRARIALEELRATAIERAKNTVRPLFRERYLSAKHARQAFYGLNHETVGKRLERIQRIEGKRVDVTYHSANLIEIRAA